MIKLSKRTDSFLLDIKHKLLYYSLRDGLYQLMDKEDCVGQKILSGHNARFKLSDSLRYLAAVTDDNEFVVFSTSDAGKTKQIWKYHLPAETQYVDFFFEGDRYIHISTDNQMCCFDIETCSICNKYRCHSYTENGIEVYSHISSFSFDGSYLYLLCKYYTSYPSYFSVIDAKTYKEIQYIELQPEFNNDYSSVLVNPSRYLCVFGLLGIYPARAYKLEDHLITDDVLFEKKLPSVVRASFSSDYKYITLWVFDDHFPGNNAYLLNAEDLSIVQKTENGSTFAPAFADGSRYWLLPGKNSIVIDTENLGKSIELDSVWRTL